jgi:hypothetical protein
MLTLTTATDSGECNHVASERELVAARSGAFGGDGDRLESSSTRTTSCFDHRSARRHRGRWGPLPVWTQLFGGQCGAARERLAHRQPLATRNERHQAARAALIRVRAQTRAAIAFGDACDRRVFASTKSSTVSRSRNFGVRSRFRPIPSRRAGRDLDS